MYILRITGDNLQKNNVFISLKIVFALANSVNTDGKLYYYAAFHFIWVFTVFKSTLYHASI